MMMAEYENTILQFQKCVFNAQRKLRFERCVTCNVYKACLSNFQRVIVRYSLSINGTKTITI
jgi:hypothetical protein